MPVVALALSMAAAAQSPHPVVSDLEIDAADRRRVRLTIAWPNAWRNERNHDAAWLVLRGPDATRGVLRLAAGGHGQIGEASVPVVLSVPEDRSGVFVAPGREHRGNVSWRLALTLEEPAPEETGAWSVGMVHVAHIAAFRPNCPRRT